DDVFEVSIVGGGIHSIESPVAFVVRMKQNQIGFDAEIAKLCDAFFLMPEKRRVETREIPSIRSSAFKRIERRLVLVVDVMLGKDAHAHLVEGRILQRRQGLLFKLIALMRP